MLSVAVVGALEPNTGAASVQLIVRLWVADFTGEPLSVTVTGTVQLDTAPPQVQLTTPDAAFTDGAKPHALAPRLQASVCAGRSASVAVAVKLLAAPHLPDLLHGTPVATGALLSSAIVTVADCAAGAATVSVQ